MTRIGVAVAALVVVGAAVAQTRRPDPAPGALLIARLPAHLADPALVDELKLTPDQVKVLAPTPGKKGVPTPAGVPTPKGGPVGAGEPAIVTRAKEVLTPEQYARAVQLMAQDALRTGRGAVVTPAALVAVPAATLQRYPELAEAAKLTRDQKRRVTAAGAPTGGPGYGGPQPAAGGYGGLPGAAHIVLTTDQTAALAAFVGPLRTTPFAAPTSGPVVEASSGRTMPSGGPVGVNPSQRIFTAINNRGELKLTDEQVNTLSGLMNVGRDVARGDDGPPMPVTPPTPASLETSLAKTLNATQLTRLKQIELWQLVPQGADDTAKFDIPRVASEVELTADQKAELKALGKAHLTAAAKAMETADSAAKLKTGLTTARKGVTDGVGKVLTAEQATKLNDLFGAEYRGGGPGGMNNDIFRRIRAAGYGHYQFEIMIVNRFAGVAEDLKLSEEQKAAMTAAETAFNQQYQQGFGYDGPEAELAKQMSVRSKAMEKVFNDHFNPDQKKRFRELCIQLRQQLNAQQGGNMAYPPTGAPGVADELKLTPEQRKRIVETGDEDEVLTADQKTALQRLAGTPISGGFNFGGPSRGRPAPPSARIALLHAGSAHADLKLDANQAYLIAEVIEAHSAELRPAPTGRNGGQPGYVEPPPPEDVEDTTKACEKLCLSVLTPAQRDRLGQLMLQASAHASLTAVFARPEVTEKLAFTPAQRKTLDDIAADFRARVTHVATLPGAPAWLDLREKGLKEMRENARARLLAVLTDRQTAAWRELTGPVSPAVAAAAGPGSLTRDP